MKISSIGNYKEEITRGDIVNWSPIMTVVYVNRSLMKGRDCDLYFNLSEFE